MNRLVFCVVVVLSACNGTTLPSDATIGRDSSVLPRDGFMPLRDAASGDAEVCPVAQAKSVSGCSAVVGNSFACEGVQHVADGETVNYQHNPPHSGKHSVAWEQQKGEHEDPVPRERWVHNLEHGAIVLLYHCKTACNNELNVLRNALDQRKDVDIILTADPALDAPRFAAVAWTWVYEFDTPDLARLLCFIDQHHRQAPEDVPL